MGWDHLKPGIPPTRCERCWICDTISTPVKLLFFLEKDDKVEKHVAKGDILLRNKSIYLV